MSDPISALNGARFDGLVQVTEMPPQGMITLRGDLASVAIKNAATGIAGVDMPGQRGVHCVGEKGICWMSPDELLVLCPYAEVGVALASMHKTLGKDHALAVDVSDARAVFQLQGAAVREVIAKLAPVDMDPAQFTPGEIRRTRLAQVPAAFWLREEGLVQVICFRSVAGYVFDLLTGAATPGGEVGVFAAG